MRKNKEISIQEENGKAASSKEHPTAKNFFKRIIDAMYNVFEKKWQLLAFIGIWALILNFLLEWSLVKNPVSAVVHIFTRPHIFIFNVLIIFCTFSVITVLKRKMFSFVLISVLWITLPIVNTILLSKRNTPFNFSDFRVLFAAFEIVGAYLSVIETILVFLLIGSALGLIVLMFIKGRKSSRHMRFSAPALGVILSITLGSVLIFNGSINSNHFANLPDAYSEFGFAYSFMCSIVDHGIQKPEGYDDGLVRDVINHIDDGVSADQSNSLSNAENIAPASESKPNVIFIQLESFFDPAKIKGLSFNKDPMPVYRRLLEENMSGWITVPSIGAGTANTEFEVLTGMDIDHFGIAEYPYLSVLQNSTCESVAYNFKEYGYAAHALHNNTGTFYDRYIVFPNLGFDTFVSIENMGEITRNENGWAKDSMLFEEILDIMYYTENQADIVYGISVQPHGKYPTNLEEYETYYNSGNPAPIKVSGNEDSNEKYAVDYWTNQIYDVDMSIGDFISRLEAFDEPTVLVMFGDHMPAFEPANMTNESGSYYCTEYVIWSNFGLEHKGDRDLYTFQLSSHVSGMLGIETGYMNMLHQDMVKKGEKYKENSTYYNEMHILQYDLLYGERYAYGGKAAYFPTNLKLGYKDIVITGISLQGDTLYVYGEGFNDPYSHIYINESKKETIYLKDGCIIADNVRLNKGDVIKVVQSTTDRIPMNQSNRVVYKP